VSAVKGTVALRPLAWLIAAAFVLTGCTAADRELLAEGVAPAASGVGAAMLLSQHSLGYAGGTTAASSSGAAAAGGTTSGATAAPAASVTSQAAQHALLRQLGGAARVAYALYDPLAPNWDIGAKPVGEGVVRLTLTMRSLATGGNGEAWPIFQRAAKKVVEQNGARTYQLLAFEEGVHSTRPFAHRYAVGEIRLLP